MPMMFSLIETGTLAQRFFAAKKYPHRNNLSIYIQPLSFLHLPWSPSILECWPENSNMNIPEGHSVSDHPASAHRHQYICTGHGGVLHFSGRCFQPGISLLCAISSNISQDFQFHISKSQKQACGIAVDNPSDRRCEHCKSPTFQTAIFNVLIKSCAIPVCGLFISVFFLLLREQTVQESRCVQCGNSVSQVFLCFQP